jgi:hypothetical protein
MSGKHTTSPQQRWNKGWTTVPVPDQPHVNAAAPRTLPASTCNPFSLPGLICSNEPCPAQPGRLLDPFSPNVIRLSAPSLLQAARVEVCLTLLHRLTPDMVLGCWRVGPCLALLCQYLALQPPLPPQPRPPQPRSLPLYSLSRPRRRLTRMTEKQDPSLFQRALTIASLPSRMT